MTLQRGFSRTAAVLAVLLAIGVCAMLLGDRSARQAGARRDAGCHLTMTHSVGGGAATKVRWVNDGSAPIGVYRLQRHRFPRLLRVDRAARELHAVDVPLAGVGDAEQLPLTASVPSTPRTARGT